MFPRHTPTYKSRRSRQGLTHPAGISARNPDNDRMDIRLNGEPRSVAASLTLQQLLEAEGLAERRVAVEINGEIVPRSRHAERQLDAGDIVEIVHALGGG